MQENKKLYKPLPDDECIKLTIAKSKIQGLGLFTKLFAPKGVNFGVSHYKIKDEIIRTPLGGFVNHSDNPNVKIERMKKTRHFNIITLRVINPGEELTGKYMNLKKEKNVI